jgi:hypothetical protein
MLLAGLGLLGMAARRQLVPSRIRAPRAWEA